MDYIDLLHLGFDRKDTEDQVYYNKTGNKSFILTYKTEDGLMLEWNPKDGSVSFFIEERHICNLTNIDDVRVFTDMMGKRRV